MTLSWDPAAGADAYSISRGFLSGLSVNSYGGCIGDGVANTSAQDTAAPGPGEGLFYLVQGQNFACGMGTLGFDTAEQERTNSEPGACAGVILNDSYPQSESAVLGSVSGSFAALAAADDQLESITEVLSSGGNPSNRFSQLEHRWTIQVSAGSQVEFHVEGFRTSSPDGDDFAFEFSTDGGGSWNPISLPSLPFLDTNTSVIGALPPGLSGAVVIRVIDTNRTQGTPGSRHGVGRRAVHPQYSLIRLLVPLFNRGDDRIQPTASLTARNVIERTLPRTSSTVMPVRFASSTTSSGSAPPIVSRKSTSRSTSI